MSDLERKNALATQQGLENLEKRIQQLEIDNLTLRNNVQTCINLVGELTQANNLALAQLRGTGTTTKDG